tara:strand:+ start:283 stop:1449 length:1167 start_codon:yes stop_codon:yes gene_type:complete
MEAQPTTRIGNIKNVAKQRMSQLKDLNREKIIAFLKKYGLRMLAIFIIIGAIVFYFTYSQTRRVNKQIRTLDKYIEYVEIMPIEKCKDYIKDYRLHDFYVASSSRSYLSGNQKYDYSTPLIIEKILRAGARFLEFDIFNKGFNQDTIPVVSNGNEDGNWQYTLNTTTFEDCCKTIAKYAFSERYLTNHSDPLFISINLKTNGNVYTVNKVADILFKYFEDYLLGKEFSYSRKNIAREHLKNLIGKVIILCDNKCNDTKLEELVNYKWGDAFMRQMEYKKIKETHDHQFDINYNMRSITMVHPFRDAKHSNNYNPFIPWSYGCQFVAINYQNDDEHLEDYILKFKERSFVLKPKKLRYKKIYYPKPKAQNPNMSMKTMNVKTPLYDIDF